MASSLADLVVNLDMDSAKFRAALGKTVDEVRGFGRRVSDTATTMKQAFSLYVVAEAAQRLGAFVVAGAEAADKTGELAQSVGVGAESLARLSFAARTAGVDADAMGKGLGKLNKAIVESQDTSSKSAQAFRALGVDAIDPATGALRDAESVFLDVADAMSRLPDGPEKTAIALQLFSRNGMALIPVLNMGRDALEELIQKGVNLGAIMSGETIAAAGAFSDQLDMLSGISTNLAAQVAAELSPNLEALVDDFANGATATEDMEMMVQELAAGMRLLATGALVTATAFEITGKFIAAVGAAAAAFLSGDWAGSDRVAEAFDEDFAKITENAKRRMDLLWADLDKPRPQEGPDITEGRPDPARKRFGSENKKLEQEIESAGKRLEKLMENYRTKVAGLQGTAGTTGDKGVEELVTLRYRIDKGDIGQDIAAKYGKGTAAAKAYADALMEAAAAHVNLQRQQDIDKAGVDAFKRITDTVQASRLEIEKVGTSAREVMELRIEKGDLSSLFVEAGLSAAVSAEQIEAARKALLDYATALDAKVAAEKVEKDLTDRRMDQMREGASLTREMQTPQEKYAATVEKLNNLLADGAIDMRTFQRAMAAAGVTMQEDMAKLNADVIKLREDIEGTLGEGLVVGMTEGFQAMGDYFAQTLERMAAQALATNLLKLLGFGPGGWLEQGLGMLLGGGGGGALSGFSGSDFSPGGMYEGWTAGGGTLWSGQATLVGEHGPEVFQPATAGHVYTTQELRSALGQQGGQRQAPSTMRVELGANALHMTMRDWLEQQIANTVATR